MARWKLTAKHYLPVPGTEWEQKETSRDTGKTVRKVYVVPLYLDPDSPADWTDHSEGLIIVTNLEHDPEHPRDLYFLGDPTPDMEPLNAEAEEISAALRPKWDHPIESLPANGGMTPAETAFMQTMMAAFAQQAATSQPVSTGAIATDRLAALEAKLAELAEQNAALLAKLNESAGPSESIARRA